MKILLLNNRYPSVEQPHIATFIKSIFESLKNCGADVDLLISSRNKLSGIPKTLDTTLYYLQLIFFTKYKLYELLYINRFNHFGFILATKIRKNHKVIIHWHGSELRNFNILHQFSFIFIKKKYFHIVPSKYYKELLMSKLNINEEKIFISPSGGVDFLLFCEKKEISYSEESIILGFASGAKMEKGFDLVLQLIHDLDDIEMLTGKDISVRLIEYGAEKETLNQIRTMSNISLVIPMKKEKMPQFYNSCDILLFPTHHESLGLVGIEAMACNKPVVGSNCTALPEYIIPGKTGELFEKDDYESFKKGVIKVINNIGDYSPREHIGNYSKDKVDDGYGKLLEIINKD